VPIGLAPDGTLVFVTLDPSGSTISKVDPARPQEVTVLAGRPLDAPDGALSRDGRFAYVPSEVGGSIARIDARSHKVLARARLGTGVVKPVVVAVSSDGRAV
jgi:DNA-binding beta-propeller fold protein YncE